MKFGSGMALSVAAASSPVAVLHDISFSSSRIRSSLAQRRAASRSLSLMAVAIGLHIVEPPEIETADAVGLEGFGEIDAVLEQRVLLLEVEVGVELVAALALL